MQSPSPGVRGGSGGEADYRRGRFLGVRPITGEGDSGCDNYEIHI